MKNCLTLGLALISIIALELAACSSQDADNSSALISESKEGSISSEMTNEQKFFKCIYQKYSSEYFPLGSDTTFSERYDPKTDSLIWKFSFLVVDSTKTGEGKYLREVNDTVVRKYLPSIHLYFGTHSHHYELGGSVNFIGFLYDDNCDFVFDRTPTGLNTGFINIIKEAVIPDKREKEEFCSSLGEGISSGLFFPNSEFKKTETLFTWIDSNLLVRIKFRDEEKNETLSSFYFTFNGKRISSISLKK